MNSQVVRSRLVARAYARVCALGQLPSVSRRAFQTCLACCGRRRGHESLAGRRPPSAPRLCPAASSSGPSPRSPRDGSSAQGHRARGRSARRCTPCRTGGGRPHVQRCSPCSSGGRRHPGRRWAGLRPGTRTRRSPGSGQGAMRSRCPYSQSGSRAGRTASTRHASSRG